jgi:hypothetical protein
MGAALERRRRGRSQQRQCRTGGARRTTGTADGEQRRAQTDMESRRVRGGIVAGSSLRAERWSGRRRGGARGQAGSGRVGRPGQRTANRAAVAVEAAAAADVSLAAGAEAARRMDAKRRFAANSGPAA